MFYILLFLALLVPDVTLANQDLTRAKCDSIMDLIIVLDSSGSIGDEHFQTAKTALVNLVSQLQIGPKKVHISIINYSDRVTVPVVFRDILVNGFTIQLLTQKILAIPYLAGGTATGDALLEARNICEQACRPFTDGAARSVVVLTDGQSNMGTAVKPAAEALSKLTKANVFAIGIGTGINKGELDIIASKPQYVLQLADYMQLTQVINNITIITCDMPVFVMINVKVESEVPANTYRYYQIDSTSFMVHPSSQGSFVYIIANLRKGHARIFSSTTNTNPQQGTGREGQMALSRDGFTQTYVQYVEPSASTFYFSLLGVDQVNEYDFTANLYDMNGNVIG